ncbi:hypothetical protein Clacol_003801 [Clathrus columnatus]|uniref:BRCT domain-containing protein n=1 Tax=Clathrus columnatus TaxID=1419009 RepID=A0AAV5A8R3_9AGAM|nr:hypothetical protein Clacol_003801 [Clathrus columnatus]
MLRRLERHIPCKIVKSKILLTPAWLIQSVIAQKQLPYDDFYAVCPLKKCTKERCPEHTLNIDDDDQTINSPPKNLSYISRFAVQRSSPIVCPNQVFLSQLAVVRDSRTLDGEDRSAMSYSRAIGILKAYPYTIKTVDQVANLPFIGVKITGMLEEFLLKGKVLEAERIKASRRYQTLKEFTTIHGIGPLTARQHYDEGCRSLEDLDRVYESDLESNPVDPPQWTGEISGMRTALELRNDLRQMSVLELFKTLILLTGDSIPRTEVEQINTIIGAELELLEPGCVRTIVGGRGKLHANDVDIVLSHPELGKELNLCTRLVDALGKKDSSGFRSTHPLHALSGASKPNHSHMDTLDKALVVFCLPQVSDLPTIHRRVDLIFAPITLYWTAVVGWGMKFDSGGITRRRDSKLFFPMTEAAVFELLGLEWIDPTLRNADV